METTFQNKNLEELFETGKSKKYKKVPKNIIEEFIEAVEFLKDEFPFMIYGSILHTILSI